MNARGLLDFVDRLDILFDPVPGYVLDLVADFAVGGESYSVRMGRDEIREEYEDFMDNLDTLRSAVREGVDREEVDDSAELMCDRLWDACREFEDCIGYYTDESVIDRRSVKVYDAFDDLRKALKK